MFMYYSFAAFAVAGPFGTVKQAFGLYTQIMAERGFSTIAFDPSYIGESGGSSQHGSQLPYLSEKSPAG